MRTRGLPVGKTSPMRSRTARTTSVPAPIGGLNARDALAQMKPTDAVIMDNWVPGTASISIRNGYIAHSTGYTDPVETLMTYRTVTAQKLFAVAGGNIYDSTTTGAVGAAIVTGLSNSHWQYANFGTQGGQFLFAVNAADKARLYNGTSWRAMTDGAGATITSITFSGTTATVTTATAHGLSTGDTVTVSGASPSDYNVTAAPITVLTSTTFSYQMLTTPATNATVVGSYIYGLSIQGVDTALIKDVQVYGRRIWMVEKNSFRVWYLGLESIAGTATAIDLAPYFVLGGSLQGMVAWTVSSAYGTTQYAVFVSSEGECLVYQGDNPDNAATWALVGTFRIGRPIGQRFYERVGTDTVLITTDGLIPLSKAAINNRLDQGDAVSYKIINLVNSDIQAYGGQFGWQIKLYPLGNKIICNAPRPQSGDTVQYVMNTITNAWCRYVSIPSYCWELLEDNVYFGGPDGVYQAETSNSDNGAAIVSDVMPAYSYFGAQGAQKLFTTVRPVVTANGNFQPAIGISTDFTTADPTSTPTLSLGLVGATWDVSLWNVGDWGGQVQTSIKWQWATGLGFAATVRMRATTREMAVSVASFDYAYEVGTGIY